MFKIIRNAKGILQTQNMNRNVSEVLKSSVSALLGDKVALLELFSEVSDTVATLRDDIFIECFQVFLLNACEYDMEKQEFVDSKMTSFVELLAEISPNEEAGYGGDKEKLQEVAMRIVKVIDDCGTIQKSFYIACLARAIRSRSINRNVFFKLSYCIRSLTEEDLIFIKNNISTNIISVDADYIDDFRALGLLKDVDGGFAYTKRAFELCKYAIDYEGDVNIPNSFPPRFAPLTVDVVGETLKLGRQEIIEESTLKWQER